MVAPSVGIVNGEDGVRNALTVTQFDPRREVVLERGEANAAGIIAKAGNEGTAAVVHDENAQVRLRATLDQPGIVMLDDQLSPGWTVRVDGRPERALHVDGVMRGVAVPAGTHTIVWSYTVQDCDLA